MTSLKRTPLYDIALKVEEYLAGLEGVTDVASAVGFDAQAFRRGLSDAVHGDARHHLAVTIVEHHALFE